MAMSQEWKQGDLLQKVQVRDNDGFGGWGGYKWSDFACILKVAFIREMLCNFKKFIHMFLESGLY